MRREKNERKVPRDLNLPQIRIKRAQSRSARRANGDSECPCAFYQRKYIYKIHAPASTIRARPPVNRFPEDVDQFRLERRRGMEKRKGERKGSLALSASEREKIFLSPFTASSSPPTLFSFPSSATLYPSFSTHPAYAVSFPLLFRVVEKNAPFGLRVLRGFRRSDKEKEKDTVSLPLRSRPFSLSSSSIFFPLETREAKLSARKLETIFPPAYARKQTRAPDGPDGVARRFSSLVFTLSFFLLSRRVSSACYVEK